MSVSSAAASIRVRARIAGFDYDLRWYDSSESLVPLWWLGAADHASGELLMTAVCEDHDTSDRVRILHWLRSVVPEEIAVRLADSVWHPALGMAS